MGLNALVSGDYPDHRKTAHLKELIGHEADCYPVRMWCWARKFALNGRFRSLNELEVVACKWRGTPGQLSTAMAAAGFLEADGLTIHDWMQRTGGAAQTYEERRIKERDRLRYKRVAPTLQTVAATNPSLPLPLPSPSRGPPLTPPGGGDVSAESAGFESLVYEAQLQAITPAGPQLQAQINAALRSGITPPALSAAFRAHPGRPIWEIVQAMRPALPRATPGRPRDALDVALDRRKGTT